MQFIDLEDESVSRKEAHAGILRTRKLDQYIRKH